MTKCRICKTEYTKRSMGHVVCSLPCSILHAKIIVKKIERKADREQRVKLKSRSDWMREAQTSVNAWVRQRDQLLPCVSCGRHHTGQYHAGHYRSVGSAPALRFSELNINKQCQPCNTHLSGNLIAYRVNLIEKIGLYEVELLEKEPTPAKWTIDQLKVIKQTYQLKLREMK